MGRHGTEGAKKYVVVGAVWWRLHQCTIDTYQNSYKRFKCVKTRILIEVRITEVSPSIMSHKLHIKVST